jgi:hypothetical protein
MKGKVLGKPTELILTNEQYHKLKAYTTGRGGNQSLCQRVFDSVKAKNGRLVAHVYDADMERITKLINRPDNGSWQDLFREIVCSGK